MLPDRGKLSFKMTDEEWDSFLAMSKRISDNADSLIAKRNEVILENSFSCPEVLDNLYIEELDEIRVISVGELKDIENIDESEGVSELPSWLDEILTGVSILEYQSSLSIKLLLLILSCLHDVSVREIIDNFELDRKQATRYFKAIKIALPLINKHFENK